MYVSKVSAFLQEFFMVDFAQRLDTAHEVWRDIYVRSKGTVGHDEPVGRQIAGLCAKPRFLICRTLVHII